VARRWRPSQAVLPRDVTILLKRAFERFLENGACQRALSCLRFEGAEAYKGGEFGWPSVFMPS
jgi:hypothetical protein